MIAENTMGLFTFKMLLLYLCMHQLVHEVNCCFVSGHQPTRMT